MDVCSLCRQKRELRQSHIIPRFVGKWLKSTSATGYIRGINEPNKRIQDLRKKPLLCNRCEQKLSKLETYFSKKIFYPYLKKGKKTFQYDDKLVKFTISASWRTLIVSYDDFIRDIPGLRNYIDEAEEAWRRFLMGDTSKLAPYEHHIFFLDYLEDGASTPSGFEWYTLRGVDATLVGNQEKVFAYTKFPWMILVSSIYPTEFKGWIKTRVMENGEITPPQEIRDGVFGEFLLDRAQKALEKIRGTSSKDIDRSIVKSIERDPYRFLSSESMKVHLTEAKKSRAIKKKKLSPFLKELVEIVERALEDKSLDLSESRYQKWGRSLVADALTNLSMYEATKLDSIIQTTLLQSKEKDDEAKGSFETDQIVMTFMVNPFCTKKQQQIRVTKELDKLLKRRKKNDKRYFAVFSFNPHDYELPYESAFFLS